MPIINEKQKNEICNGMCAIVVVNFYGVFFPINDYCWIPTRSLIIDNTQAFYEPPRKGAYNVYSCRKFFGVSDGAYLIKEGIQVTGRLFYHLRVM